MGAGPTDADVDILTAKINQVYPLNSASRISISLVPDSSASRAYDGARARTCSISQKTSFVKKLQYFILLVYFWIDYIRKYKYNVRLF